ncbi:MAG: DMT family transporter [Muribaculaceae bacterium]|nr:DMT family transporter [Muribaculaceae bacterium]
MKTGKGIALGVLAAVSYGTNPLFAVPLYNEGLSTESVLFYRYSIAAALLGLIIFLRGESFRLPRRTVVPLVVMGIVFALSSLLLFESYRFMDVGIASTLLFLEPVFLALIMRVVFRERLGRTTIVSIIVCAAGIGLLCNPGAGANVSVRGIVLVILSAFSYGVYMAMVNKSEAGKIGGPQLTFYSLLFGMIVFAFATRGFADVQGVELNATNIACVAGIATVPTIISLVAVNVAIQEIGAVPVSILGALEPITGSLVGILFFGEIMTGRSLAGMALIIGAVMLLIYSKRR